MQTCARVAIAIWHVAWRTLAQWLGLLDHWLLDWRLHLHIVTTAHGNGWSHHRRIPPPLWQCSAPGAIRSDRWTNLQTGRRSAGMFMTWCLSTVQAARPPTGEPKITGATMITGLATATSMSTTWRVCEVCWSMLKLGPCHDVWIIWIVACGYDRLDCTCGCDWLPIYFVDDCNILQPSCGNDATWKWCRFWTTAGLDSGSSIARMAAVHLHGLVGGCLTRHDRFWEGI